MPLLEIRNLKVVLNSSSLLKGLTFSLNQGEILGILGESGSGKSLTALTIMGLLPPGIKVSQGEILYKGVDLLKLEKEALNKLRGKEISIIFQDPLSSLNPVLTIEDQLKELCEYHLGVKGREGKELILKSLKEVGIPDPELRLRSYPHQLSGGLRQRVMLAMAILCEPQIVIADEPTTALDPTLQIQILSLLKTLTSKKNLSLLFITHDIGLIRWLADRVLVFYKGTILELAPTTQLFKNPLHPYTKLLLNSYPGEKRLFSYSLREPLKEEGNSFCDFRKRCPSPCKRALEESPVLKEVEKEHKVACFLYE